MRAFELIETLLAMSSVGTIPNCGRCFLNDPIPCLWFRIGRSSFVAAFGIGSPLMSKFLRRNEVRASMVSNRSSSGRDSARNVRAELRRSTCC